MGGEDKRLNGKKGKRGRRERGRRGDCLVPVQRKEVIVIAQAC